MPTVVDELRAALARHDEWPTAETGVAVIDTARRLIQAIDGRAALIEDMRRHVTPTQQAMGELLGDPDARC